MPGRRALIAEEQIHVARMLEGVLQRWGYETRIAGDGVQALRAAQETLPDVIVLGMFMPVMCGREVLAALRRDPSTARIPVVMVSTDHRATVPVDDRLEYVPKPFDLPTLSAAVERLMPSAV